MDKEVEKQQCRDAAGMVVDALIDADLLKEEDTKLATDIAEEELIVRKTIGKL